MAAGGIVAVRNHDGLSRLKLRESMEGTRIELEEDWGIRNRDDAVRQLAELKGAASTRAFRETYGQLERLSGSQFEHTCTHLTRDHKDQVVAELVMVRKYGSLLGNAGILAWDECRRIYLARTCVTARILSEEGLTVDPPGFAGADVISLAKGRVWPETLRRRRPALTSVSVIMSARR